MMISPSHRRLIVLAASIFIISSVYLSTTRLYAMSYTPNDNNLQAGNGDNSNKNPPEPIDPKTLPPDFKLTNADLPMSYGEYDRPKIQGLETLVSHLDQKVIPTASNGRRLIVVGDIHGMVTALDELLEKVGFDEATDHLVAVGDMINKGPDSTDVIQRLIKLRASAVRGNHEDRVLLSRGEIDSQNGVSADLDAPDTGDRKGQLSDLVTARLLTQEQVDWLSHLPVIIDVPELRMHIVHAGLMPGIELNKQDPWAAMNMRTINYPREAIRAKEGEQPLRKRDTEKLADVPETSDVGRQKDEDKLIRDDDDEDNADAEASIKTTADADDDDNDLDGEEGSGTGGPGSALHGEPRDGPGFGANTDSAVDKSEITFDRAVAVPSAGSEGDAWNEAWDAWQKRLQPAERYTVIYGHDARHGYVESKYTFGLDSGCVKGNQLTALVITGREGGGFMHQKASVKCHGRS